MFNNVGRFVGIDRHKINIFGVFAGEFFQDWLGDATWHTPFRPNINHKRLGADADELLKFA